MKRLLVIPAFFWMALLAAQTLNPRLINPNGPIYETAAQGDTVYSVGFFSRVGYQTGGAAWFNNSMPDTKFPITDGEVYAILSDGGGGWYLGGLFTKVDTISRSNLVHILSTGEVDPNFNFPVNNEVRCLARNGTQLFVGGKFTQVNNQPRNYFARIDFSLSGFFLNGWAPNPDDYVYSLAVSSDNLYIGGSFTTISNVNQPAFAAFNLQTRNLLQTVTPGTGQVNTMVMDGNKLFAGGTFLGSTGYYTGKAALIQGNNEIPNFAFPRFGGNVHAMVPDGNGGWYVGGAFTQVNGSASGRLVHILPDFSINPSFAPSPNGTVFALHLSGDTLYVGGTFSSISSQARTNLAAIKTTNSALLPWQPEPNGKVSAIASDAARVFLGGSFSRVSGEHHPRFAALNRNSGSATQTVVPASGEVHTLLVTPSNGGHVFAGGSFSGSVGFPAGKAAILSASNEISTPKLPDFNGDIYAVVADGSGGWYVSGSFSAANNQPMQRLAHILPDSTLDNTFSFTINNAVYALSLSGNTLYLGGIFTSVNGSTRNNLAAIDLSSKSLLPWDPNAGGQVNAILAEAGTVYIGGSFTTIGGQTRNRLAAVDGTNATLLPWNPDANQVVNAMDMTGAFIYAAGNFTTIGGSTYNRLVRIDKTSGVPDSWNPNVNSEVNSMLFRAGNSLLIGGNFTMVGSTLRNRLAELDLNSAAPTAFNPNVNGSVESLALMNGRLYAGGAFTQVGGQPFARLAAIDMNTSLPDTWSPNPDNAVHCLAASGNRLFSGGGFNVLKTVTRNRLMDFQSTTLALQPWAPNLNNAVNALSIYQSELVAGGQFTQADGQTRNRLASWNIGTQALSGWNPSADNTVNALSVRNDTLIVAGTFQSLAGESRPNIGAVKLVTGNPVNWNPKTDEDVFTLGVSGTTLAIGGSFNSFSSQTRNRLFCLDVTTGFLTSWAPDLPGIFFGPRVNALAVSGDSVWVGGSFSSLSGVPRQNLALTNGLTGQILSPMADTKGEVFALHTVGNDLWVGGKMLDSINHVSRGNIAVIDRSTGSVRSFDPAADSYVFSVSSFQDRVVIGGSFEQVMSQPRGGGFAIESSTGRLLPWNPGTGMNSQIVSLALDTKMGHAYVGGYFSTLHGQDRQNLARINLSDGQPDNWRVDADQSVNQLIWEGEGNRLFAGGEFFTLGGQSRKYLGLVDATGQLLPFNPDPDQSISAIAYFDETLYVSGTFTSIGGQPRNRLAALNDAGQALPWAPVITTYTGLGRINDIEVGADKLYIGGFFIYVNGETRYRTAAFDLNTGDLLPWTVPVDSISPSNSKRVTRIREFNNNLFLLGAITDINGTSVDNIAWLDPLSGLVKGLRIIPGGQISDVSAIDSLLYLAGNFTNINGKNNLNFASYSFAPNFFSRGYTDIIPKRGGNVGDLTVNIYGGGFPAGVQVILHKSGLPDIVATDSLTSVLSGIQIRATFNLRNQSPGFRDVLLISAGDTTVITNGFEVIDGGETDVWADIVIPENMRVVRPGRSDRYPLIVNFGNNGTIDAEGVPLWIALDTALRVISFESRWIPQGPGGGNPEDQDLYSVQLDTIFGDAFGANVYVILLPRIPAGSQGTLVIYVAPKREGTVYVQAWATDPFYGSPLKYFIGECHDLIIAKIAGVVPIAGCIYNALDALLSPMFDAAYDPANFATLQWASSYSITLANAIVDCGILATGGGLVLEILQDLLKLPNTINDLNTIFTQCIPLHPQPKPTKGGGGVKGSMDPNQKSGPGGAGPQRWISETTRMPYLVEFENIETASAPAQTVIIIDTLDADIYDLSSLQLNFFSIADSIFPIQNGRQRWTSWVDLRPRVSSLVRMDVALTGEVLRWEFESLDPLTLELQSGVFEGFLPPNINGSEGTGAVSFTINRRKNLPTNTRLKNSAAIYFDNNAPLYTNTWVNTLDIDAPQSQIAAIDTLRTTTSIPLSWNGSDVGSGVKYYQVMVSENGGVYRPALEYFTGNSVTFTGIAGNTYAFYTLAVDSAGNIEAAPATPDVITRVAVNTGFNNPQPLQFVLYPNPNDGQFTLIANLPATETATWEVLDMTGRILMQQTQLLHAGENRLPVTLDLPNGFYIAVVRTAAGSASYNRFVISR